MTKEDTTLTNKTDDQITAESLILLPESRHHKVQVRLAALGITSNAISKLWGCTPQQLLYWSQSDHRDVKSDTLDRLAEILGVSVSYLTEDHWKEAFSPVPAWLRERVESLAEESYSGNAARKAANMV